jgi:hypothetical protein
VSWRHNGGTHIGREDRTGVVVAGPGLSVTIPGIIVSEIVRALAKTIKVTRIEVDITAESMAGLHRARSLAAAHNSQMSANIVVHHAPSPPRLRAQAFRNWIGPEVDIAIAYTWPSLDNGWIKQYLEVARTAGCLTVVLCESLPRAQHEKIASLAELMYQADYVFIGDASEATELAGHYGTRGPKIEAQRALSLGGKGERTVNRKITAFLPKDSGITLTTVLAAFDAIPKAWINDYRLQLIMRYAGGEVPDMIADSYHANHVQLVGEEMSALDLEKLCSSSSALGVADPAIDSRAFSAAMESGVATVVLANSPLPSVGQGYVGGLLADMTRSASVNVAMNHALRLEALRFPSPDAWDELANRLGQLMVSRASERFEEIRAPALQVL